MTNPVISAALVCFSLRLLPVVVSVLVKTMILLALAFVLHWIMRNASPGLRHRLWLSAIVCCLLVLGLSLRGPLYKVGPWPSNAAANPIAALSSALVPPAGSFVVERDLPAIASFVWRPMLIPTLWPAFWPPLLVFLLVVGALWGWLRMLGGRVKLARAGHPGKAGPEHEHDRSVRELSRLLGIRRKVRVIEVAGVTTALARGILRPVIVLPPAMRTWSAARMRSVLLHELWHIRRGDSFTLAAAYGICSLLWFVPLIWAAYSRLCMEQEKECDAAVLDRGVRRHSYAACVLDAAQLCREPALQAGLGFSGRRKEFLKDRIQAIIGGGKKMKKGLVVFGFSVVLLAAGVLLSAAGTEGKGKVLMVLRSGNAEAADFMLTQEAAVMKFVIEDAGYLVVVATVDGQPAKGSSMTMKADLRMADVQVADYKGLVVPCMAAGDSPIPAESVLILKKAMAAKKPIAAQNSAVLILDQAGVIGGKKFAIEADLASAVKDGLYSGIGVVQDGILVTSGTCPLMAAQIGKPDGTQELTRMLIALIK